MLHHPLVLPQILGAAEERRCFGRAGGAGQRLGAQVRAVQAAEILGSGADERGAAVPGEMEGAALRIGALEVRQEDVDGRRGGHVHGARDHHLAQLAGADPPERQIDERFPARASVLEHRRAWTRSLARQNVAPGRRQRVEGAPRHVQRRVQRARRLLAFRREGRDVTPPAVLPDEQPRRGEPDGGKAAPGGTRRVEAHRAEPRARWSRPRVRRAIEPSDPVGTGQRAEQGGQPSRARLPP